MKKFAFLLLIFILSGFTLKAQCDDEKKSLLPSTHWRMDINVAYYHPSSKEVRDIFSSGWIDYQFEISRKNYLYDKLELFLSVNWAHKRGTLPPFPCDFHNSTKAHIAPFTFGFKRFFRVNSWLESYIGLGVCYSLITLRNHSDYHNLRNHSDFYSLDLGSNPFRRYVYKDSIGGLLRIGCRISYGKSTFFNFFGDYYLTEKVKFSHRELHKKHLNFSGLKLGGGIGVYF